MTIEIDILNGDTLWPLVKPLFETVWPSEEIAKLGWGDIQWANADFRVIIEEARRGAVCHVGIYRRDGIWKGRKTRIGGIGGVATHPDCRRKGYASLALNAAIQTLRDERAMDFALLFCEPHNVAFYRARGWHAFEGEVFVQQHDERVRFEAMLPQVLDLRYGPREGVIDLCGLPW